MSLAMVVAAAILLVVAGFALSRTQNVVVRVAVVVVLAQVFLHRLVVPEQLHAGLGAVKADVPGALLRGAAEHPPAAAAADPPAALLRGAAEHPPAAAAPDPPAALPRGAAEHPPAAAAADPPAVAVPAGCVPSLAALSDAERSPRRGPRHQVEPPASRVALVCCETTAGPLSVAVRPRWAPRGAKRFMDMVRGGYFSSKVPLMRCVKGFLCQFGLPGIPSLAKAFGGSFPDDPSWLPHGPKHWKVGGVERFAKGYLAYAGAGPNSRGNQFIVSLAPSERLCGGSPWEVPWGEVVGGFGTLDAISTAYGEKGPSQGRLAARGAEGLEEAFPLLDYVTSCVAVEDATEPADWAPYAPGFRHATFEARDE